MNYNEEVKKAHGIVRLLLFVLEFRIPVFILGVLLTIFFAYQASKLTLLDDTNKWLPESNSYTQINNMIQEDFGGSNVVVIQVAVKEGDIFNEETLSKVMRISDKILLIKGVVPYYLSSLSAPKVKYMKGTEDLCDITFLMETVPETPEEMERLKYGVFHNPTIYGPLVSTDNKATLIIADFRTIQAKGKWSTTVPEIYRQVKEICEAENDDNTEISYAGVPIIIGWVGSDALPLVGIAFVCFLLGVGIFLFSSFRHLIGIMLPLSLGMVVTIWAFGFRSLIFGHTLGSASCFIVPFVLIAASTFHTVQFLKRFYGDEYRGLIDSKSALANTFRALFSPMVISLISDWAGFAVCALIPFENVSIVGFMGMFGLLSLILAYIVFFIPALSFFPGKPDKKDEKIASLSGSWLDKFVRFFVEEGKLRWVVVTTLFLVFVYSLFNLRNLEPGQNNTYAMHNYLTKSWERNEIFQMEMALKERFQTIYPLNILIETNNENELKEPHVLERIDILGKHLMDSNPHVGGVIALPVYIKLMNRLFHEEDEEFFIVPEQRGTVAEYLYLYDLGQPGSFDMVVDKFYRRGVLVAYVDSTECNIVNNIVQDAKDFVRNEFNGEGMKVHIGGGAIGINAGFNELVAKWIILAILFSALATFLIVVVLMRSFLAGAFLILSEIVTLSVWLTIIHYLGLEINSHISTSAAILMGIGVDAEVYYLFRFREEYKKSRDFKGALVNAFSKIRMALIFSNMALIVGCWTLVPIPHYIGYVGFAMGLILLLVFFISFVVDPFLWSLFKPRFLTKGITFSAP